MNKRQIISSLNDIAENLDNNSFYSEANVVTNVMKKIAQFNDGRDKSKFHSLRDVTTRPAIDISNESKKIGISQKVFDMAKTIKKENAYQSAKWVRKYFNAQENDFLDKVISKQVDPDDYDINSIQNWTSIDNFVKKKPYNDQNENYLESSASRYFLDQINLFLSTSRVKINSGDTKSFLSKSISHKRLMEEINVNDNLSVREKQYLLKILNNGIVQLSQGQRPQQVYVPFQKNEH